MGDIHAMGGVPVSALVSVTLPFAAPGIVERDLEQLLRGVLQGLGEGGAVLIGGHTAEGAEMAVGLTINGTVGDGAPWRKGGARPGDRLILTKALGTGVLLAAEMARAARGRDVETALRGMVASNAAAVGILRKHRATACTDITGFGLGGHLLEMLQASGCGAVLDEAALPLLPGAADLLAAGHASTLHPANRAVAETGLRRNRAGNPRRSADGRRSARGRSRQRGAAVPRGSATGRITRMPPTSSVRRQKERPGKPADSA